ncbi:MAG: hypothetical protein AAF637_14575 [Pseudomonadota bacterium]
MTAYLIVRAQVDPSVRTEFDAWYQEEHLPEALGVFGARAAERGWSTIEPDVHYAFYAFPDLEAAKAVMGSEALKALIKEFDRRWDGKVVRSRDIVEIQQAI